MMSRKTVRDCHRHAIKRARERYDIHINDADLIQMADLIRKGRRGEAKHLLNESVSRTHWLIKDQYIVVYNKSLSCITTFLPPESIFLYLKPVPVVLEA